MDKLRLCYKLTKKNQNEEIKFYINPIISNLLM